MKSITLPKATKIKEHAFQGCVGLESAELPSMMQIENGTFEGCTSLKYVTLASIFSDTALEKAEDWGLQPGCIMACQDKSVKI